MKFNCWALSVLVSGSLFGTSGVVLAQSAPPTLMAPPPAMQAPAESAQPGDAPQVAYPAAGPVIEMRTTDLSATLYQNRGAGDHVVFFGPRPRYSYRLRWDEVCRAPCGVQVAPDGLFQIRGIRMNPSGLFSLPQNGLLQLDVRAGSRGLRSGGVILTTFGGMATLVGLVLTGVSFLKTDRVTGEPSSGLLAAGGITLGAGVLMLGGGITMLVLSRTVVTTRDGVRIAQQGDGRPRLALSAAGLHF